MIAYYLGGNVMYAIIVNAQSVWMFTDARIVEAFIVESAVRAKDLPSANNVPSNAVLGRE